MTGNQIGIRPAQNSIGFIIISFIRRHIILVLCISAICGGAIGTSIGIKIGNDIGNEEITSPSKPIRIGALSDCVVDENALEPTVAVLGSRVVA